MSRTRKSDTARKFPTAGFVNNRKDKLRCGCGNKLSPKSAARVCPICEESRAALTLTAAQVVNPE